MCSRSRVGYTECTQRTQGREGDVELGRTRAEIESLKVGGTDTLRTLIAVVIVLSTQIYSRLNLGSLAVFVQLRWQLTRTSKVA
jgi:hypothetical protein